MFQPPAQVYERMHGSQQDEVDSGNSTPSPNPNNPSEYCSTVPPTQQVDATAPPPVVMVPVGVLRKEGKFSGVCHIGETV